MVYSFGLLNQCISVFLFTEGSNPFLSFEGNSFFIYHNMSLKKYNSVTPGTRHRRIVDKSELWAGSSEKSLSIGVSKSAGRNSVGKITVPHRGGGNKRIYRKIHFDYKYDVPATVLRIEYDPNRSAFIALVKYDTILAYVLAPQSIKAGDVLNEIPCKIGSFGKLKDIPIGSFVFNVELIPNKGGQLIRAAGNYAQINSKRDGFVSIVIGASNRVMELQESCKATIGKISNPDHMNYKAGKAGISRLLGRRPSVKGEAMNPVDHPHGGRTRGGRVSVSYSNKISHGKKTVIKK